jgi:hypothetical protein
MLAIVSVASHPNLGKYLPSKLVAPVRRIGPGFLICTLGWGLGRESSRDFDRCLILPRKPPAFCGRVKISVIVPDANL